ncbi:MAG TPA: isoprenyl transferase [Nitrospinae bacterium]|nr:isoprenyl transferase [Nitrospinota bacterium]
MDFHHNPSIDPDRVPAHIAIIMDGNGRWAKKRFLPRIAGHREGVKAVDRIVSHARRLGVKALTLYSFSLENWSRPQGEVAALMEILAEFLERELTRILAEGIRFNAIGHIEDLPKFAQEWVHRAMEETVTRDGMVLTLALSYSSQREIADAAQALAREVLAGKISPDDIDEDDISRNLYTSNLPALDLMIRTSGELRLSNYLLWQAAYAELYFTDLYWPDFSEQELDRAILAYQTRVRKFGLTEDQISSRQV